MTSRQLFSALRWIDGTPLNHMEPYRMRLFERFEERDERGRFRYNLGLDGRAKKNWKTTDLVLRCFSALLENSPYGSQVYLIANDEDQARDDLSLAKTLIRANPPLQQLMVVRKNIIERHDDGGFIKILPAKDAVGAHGKTFRLLAVDEVHGYRDWDLLEALSPDPSRPDTQTWVTSYASIFHRPGVPLYDLMQQGRAGADPRMLFSWYAADFTTDVAFVNATPEERANPSMASWGNPEYLAQQQRRLPAHKFRRLHLNLPGLPEGSAFSAEAIMDATARGIRTRQPEPGLKYVGFVDMSGGSNDDAVLAIAHQTTEQQIVLDRVLNQGAPPPFDPQQAVVRFAAVLREFRISTVTGDRYAGETFPSDFKREGIKFQISTLNRSELYEALEPLLNGHRVVLLDESKLEQQLLGLVWRGGKIDHPVSEHDDWSNASAGAVVLTSGKGVRIDGAIEFMRREMQRAQAEGL